MTVVVVSGVEVDEPGVPELDVFPLPEDEPELSEGSVFEVATGSCAGVGSGSGVGDGGVVACVQSKEGGIGSGVSEV